MTRRRFEPLANIRVAPLIDTANSANLAFQGNQRQQGMQLAQVEMFLQGGLLGIIDQFVLEQLRVGLADVDFFRHFRQVRAVQPGGKRLRRVEAQGGHIGRRVLQREVAQVFAIAVERVGQGQATGLETVGDGDFQ